MNHEQIYNLLISNAKTKNRSKAVGLERHHIIPISMGGDNSITNTVYLTTREHFIAHKLLVKITVNDIINHKKMIYAFWWMCKTRHQLHSNIVNSRTYEYAREQYSIHNPNKDPERKKRFIANRKAGLYKYDSKAMGKSLSRSLKAMSPEAMSKRIQNSMRTCDDTKRGQSISKGKSSILELHLKTGEIIVFATYDDVKAITGYAMWKIIYQIKRHSGILPNGNVVKYISRYTGNDSRLGKKTKKGKRLK